MQLLANENFPLDAVEALKAAGHDVLWIRTSAPGAEDDAVLAQAVREQRILLTFDKDFGELAYRSGLPATCGIVLFRFSARSPQYTTQRIVTAIESRRDWQGNFAVVEELRIRLRPLPRPQS